MAGKGKETDVLIDGKIFTLAGEDPGYIQQLSGYINSKIAEVRREPVYRTMDSDYRQLMLEMNIADDYFRAKQEAKELAEKCAQLEKELYAARHDAVSSKVKLENTLKNQRY